ncbi:hypothetical protein HMPREF9123_0029 [Neisseria bacilliformis ATCC BAA-1200]|uniref:Uncharacterized protein n=1 Tax=Neisseria bacilliformis ATCC BAA-1200 TaxID=888742 RepID=F2B8K9_9NEIS|nr:hypothetical protein HMPREF9123_0029 [Neisseria bacilliformis ATCC BAA-1200]
MEHTQRRRFPHIFQVVFCFNNAHTNATPKTACVAQATHPT